MNHPGARAYVFHAVPYDWPDAECARIFVNVKGPVKRGDHCELLFYEIILPTRVTRAS